ncbi:hypothetical protein AB4Y90_08885 [Chryseobacterium sp. 2TAF14]
MNDREKPTGLLAPIAALFELILIVSAAAFPPPKQSKYRVQKAGLATEYR